MRILTVVGARPQFIKAAVVSRAIDEWNREDGMAIEEIILHTGQHHDTNMSQVFFDELEIRKPGVSLNIGGGGHGAMTGRMLEAIETEVQNQRPDWVLVYGDTNSTLAGALAAAKLHVPVAHVEAGLRSFNRRMPEEVNRVLTDHISRRLFCPTETAVRNLSVEGITQGVLDVGDVMLDASLHYRERAAKQSRILERLNVNPHEFVLATCHRAENTDDPQRLSAVLSGLKQVSRRLPVVLPLHPRTRQAVDRLGLNHLIAALRVVEPLPFLDMIELEANAKLIMTDSGGVQKEAFFFRVPCVTLRDETEWVETVDAGWNTLVGADETAIAAAAESVSAPADWPVLYGEGRAGHAIVAAMANS